MSFQRIKGENNIVLYKAQMFDKLYDALPAGIYQLTDAGGQTEDIPHFKPLTEKDSLVSFKSDIIENFVKEVDTFLSPKTVAAYSDLKITHKTGYILYGKPGTGKTCLCTLAMQVLVEKHGAICLDATKTSMSFVKRTIPKIRGIQPSPIVIFFDECELPLNKDENSFLPFLDGNDSVSGTIFIGCTNYIDKIPSRIKNRKSRIKRCIEIKTLPIAVYRQYITSKIPNISEKIISEFCFKASEGELTIDQFKNAVIDYYLYSVDIDKAISDAKETYGEDPPKNNNIPTSWFRIGDND